MILENVIFIPWYSNVSEFIEVNIGYRDAEAAIFTPVRAETEDVFGAAGEGLNWEGIRSFATIHRTVWLARYDAGRYRLDEVGSVLTATQQPVNDALVDFGGGARIEAAAALRSDDGRWRIVLDWWAAGPVDGEIFVHVRDRNDMLVGQIDGPALGGMVPIWMWERGDRIRDIRYIGDLEGDQPFRVQVGIYNESGRLPAWMSGIRCPDDAASVVVLEQ